MKNILKDILFIIIFIILLQFCTKVFVLKGNGYGSDVISFYNVKKNSLDVMFFGSSHSYATFSPDIIRRETNLKSYNFATQQQPIYMTYYYMKEALKRQKPKFFVLEERMLAIGEDYTTEGVIRDAIDKMKFSYNKINIISASVENKKDWPSYYFNIIKYHSRYNELTKNDIKTALTNKGINNQGYIALDAKENIIVDNSEILKITEKEKISKKNLDYLKKIIKLAEDNNIKLIIVKSPCKLIEEDYKKYNWIEDYARKHNIEYIDYNKKVEELNITINDYYDEGHLSKYGSEKVSIDFAKHLDKKKAV